MKSQTILLPILTLLLSTSALAQEADTELEPKEHWKCHDWAAKRREPGEHPVLFEVKQYVNYVGEVLISGNSQAAMFKFQGLDRRWNWGLDEDGGYLFSITIKPNGEARYYDFSSVDPGKTKSPNELYFCRMQ